IWSGVGLFYAVVLWFCAGQMGGAEILGQTAAVALLTWLGWQTLLLRRTTTPAPQQTPLRFGSARTAKQRLAASGRPTMEYEFVEDGVAVTLGDAESPQAVAVDPIGTLVVPAAVVPDTGAAESGESTADLAEGETTEGEAVRSQSPKQALPERETPEPEPQPVLSEQTDEAWGDELNDLGPVGPEATPSDQAGSPMPAAGALLSGIRSILGRQKKAPQPMVELPPRPPSIPSLNKKKGSQPMVELPPRPPSIPGLGKKKKSQPMVELPPRPRAIPRPGQDAPPANGVATDIADSKTDSAVNRPAAAAEVEPPETAMLETATSETPTSEPPNPETPTAEPISPPPSASVPDAQAPRSRPTPADDFDDEDSNWPDDEDWV
ncbi:MAG: Ycf66 family protein, partial [Cyanobacteria bacterium P01_D01_bin.14]